MAALLRDFKDGIGSYFEAIKIIREHRLWGYLMVPGLLSVLFGVGIFFGAQSIAGSAADFVAARYPWETGADVVRRIAVIVSTLAVWAGALLIYKYVILILVAPFMSPLSEKVEGIVRSGPKTEVKFSVTRFFREMIRGIRISLRNIIRELFFTLLLVIASSIPLVNLVTAPAIFLVQAYYAGFGNMDFTLERHMGVKGSARFVRHYKGLAMANGTLFLVMLMIPVVGLFLAPGLSTVAGTVETVQRLEHEAALV